MKNKGFTLIELLAVIVILAIIALIATPIILGIIEDSRKSAADRTAELVASEIQLAYSGYMIKASPASPNDFCKYMTTDYFSMDGAVITTTCAPTATAGNKNVVVTVGTGANASTYSVAYVDSTQTATITYSGGNNTTKEVRLGRTASS